MNTGQANRKIDIEHKNNTESKNNNHPKKSASYQGSILKILDSDIQKTFGKRKWTLLKNTFDAINKFKFPQTNYINNEVHFLY